MIINALLFSTLHIITLTEKKLLYFHTSIKFTSLCLLCFYEMRLRSKQTNHFETVHRLVHKLDVNIKINIAINLVSVLH